MVRQFIHMYGKSYKANTEDSVTVQLEFPGEMIFAVKYEGWEAAGNQGREKTIPVTGSNV